MVFAYLGRGTPVKTCIAMNVNTLKAALPELSDDIDYARGRIARVVNATYGGMRIL